MKTMSRRLIAGLLILMPARAASAQTAAEVVDKTVAAIGGRSALGKLTSRTSTGTITLSTPGGDVSGSVEVFNKAPNKSRTLIKIDLSSLGAGQSSSISGSTARQGTPWIPCRAIAILPAINSTT
jgi:polyisoprenoid-binding protein YceI